MELPKERAAKINYFENIDFRTAAEKRRQESYEKILNTYLELQSMYPDQPKSRVYSKVAEIVHKSYATVRKVVLEAQSANSDNE